MLYGVFRTRRNDKGSWRLAYGMEVFGRVRVDGPKSISFSL
jgi:hypothetical protein